MQCHVCHYSNRPEAQFCAMCGTRISRLCDVCGKNNGLDYRFCIHCGARLLHTNAITERGDDKSPEDVLVAQASVQDPPTPVQPSQFSGEKRVATIILADVRGSTDLLELVGTEAWVAMMNRVFQIVEAEIYRYGGKVDQFRGDGLVALFGTEIAHEDDPERAVLAALAMQKALRPYAASLRQTEGIDLTLRIGVNTGEVIVGSIGDYQRYAEYTAMGGAVALAARMETAAEPGTVLVSDNTYRLIESRFDWQNLGSIRVKGLSRDIDIYRPLAPKSANDLAMAFDLSVPFIGRDHELKLLTNAVEDLEDGLGGIILLSGERGMGKSLLLRELRQYFSRQQALRADISSRVIETEMARESENPHAREIRGRGRSYDLNRPYAVWQDLLYNWLGVREDETPEMTRNRFRQRCIEVWGTDHNEPYIYLGILLGLPIETDLEHPITKLDADVLRQRFFQAVREWLEALVLDGPLIVTLSDLHWVDETSLELLKYCLPMCDYLDLLWIIVFRPDRNSPVWRFRFDMETEYPHRLISLQLQPLTNPESKSFIDKMLGENVLSDKALDLLINKAEGNPYYIQELVRALIANGTLEHVSSTGEDTPGAYWRVNRPIDSLDLPDSLQSLLLARIDRLNEAQQSVVQRAAVIGPVFWSDILEAISSNASELRAHLTVLQRNQLITERGRTQDMGIEYKFSSRLICDAAYESLLRPQRMALHAEIAHYLEERFSTSAMPANNESDYYERYYGRIIHHYHNADMLDKELVYILKNAKHAQEVYANNVAASLYNQALEVLDVLRQRQTSETQQKELKRQRFDILIARHSVNYLLGEFELQREDAETLLSLARELGDQPDCLIDAILRQPGVTDQQSYSEVEQGIPMAEEALELARVACDEQRELESLIAIINQKLALSDPEWQPMGELALQLARELGNRQTESRILIGMGGIYAFSDEPERGMEYLEAAAALAMSEGMEDRITQMNLLNLLGLEFERSGDYTRLLNEYQLERLNLSRELGHRPLESQALQACGRIRGIYLGDLFGGLSDLEECERILEDTRQIVYPLFHQVHIYVMLAQHTEATEILNRITAIGIPVYDRARASFNLLHCILYNAQSARAISLGDLASARKNLLDSIDYADLTLGIATSSPLVSNQYAMAAHCKASVAYLGLSHLAQDEDSQQDYLNQALEHARKAYELFQDFGFTQIIECVSEEVLFRYSQTLLVNGQVEEALKFLRRAYDEMIRKYELIPLDSPYRKTYLEQIALHQEIQAAYTNRVGALLSDETPEIAG